MSVPGLTLERLTRVLERPLSAEQAAVVTAPLASGVVVAGAGTGKTETMAARVAWLVATGQVAPEHVLGLTFTRKAADELAGRMRLALRRLRAAGLLPAADGSAGEPVVSTYHAYAGRLVRDHALRLGREPGARLITPATSWQLAARTVAAYDGPMDAVEWTEPTVVQAVLALAGDLSEHLVDAAAVRAVTVRLDALAAEASKLLAPGRKVQTCQRTRAQLLPLVEQYAAGQAPCASCSTSATTWRWPPSSPADCPEVRPPSAPGPRRAARRVPGHRARPDRAAAPPVRRRAPGHRGRRPVPVASTAGAARVPATLRRFAATFPRPQRRHRARRRPRQLPQRRTMLASPTRVAAPLRADGASPCPSCGPGRGARADRLVRAPCSRRRGRGAAGSPAIGRDGAGTRCRPGDRGRARRCSSAAGRRSRAAPTPCERAGLPVEIVGLGGLLHHARRSSTSWPRCGCSATRPPAPRWSACSTGARWRIGPRDLAALGRRALALARRGPPPEDPVRRSVPGPTAEEPAQPRRGPRRPPAAGRRPATRRGAPQRLHALRGRAARLRRRLHRPAAARAGRRRRARARARRRGRGPPGRATRSRPRPPRPLPRRRRRLRRRGRRRHRARRSSPTWTPPRTRRTAWTRVRSSRRRNACSC